MTKIKFCGLSRPCDIAAANACRPAYVGFVFASASRRYVPPERAEELRALLMPEIRAVGVFVNEKPERIARIADRGIIDLIQLHGTEDEAGIRQGDVITAFDGKEVTDIQQLQELLQYYSAGETVEVTLKTMGDGGYVDKTVTLTLSHAANTSQTDSESAESSDDVLRGYNAQ